MTKTQVLNSGITPVPLAGRYFEILSATAAITVRAFGADGRVLHDEAGVQAGYYIDRPPARVNEGFVRLEFESATGANQVTWTVTDGLSGTKASPSNISDNASRELGLVSVKGAAHTGAAKTAGAASSQCLAANASRRYLCIQNQSSTEDAYISTDGDAAAVNNGSIKIPAGGVYEPLVAPTGEIRMIRGGAVDVSLHVIEA